MAEIKNILFITTQLPYPPVSGGVIKSWRLVEYLARHYKLAVAYFLKNNDSDNEEIFLKSVNLDVHISIPLDIPRTPYTLVKSNLLRMPLNLFRNKSTSFRNQISSISDKYECIFIDHYEMYQYVPENYSGKIVLHQHNCEYLMWKRFGDIEKNILKKAALYNQSFWIKRYEKKICESAHTILAAPNDIDELVAIGAERKKFFPTYHLGDEELLQLPSLTYDNNNRTLLYIGTLSWEANVDGLVWFISEVWEKICTQIEGVRLTIVGKTPDPRIKTVAANYDNIEFTGFVEELDTVYRNAQVFICPLRFGSGIKVKVMNALYRGIPCVTSNIGAEGLEVQDGRHILLAQSPEDYIKQIQKVMTTKDLWEKISVESRKLAATHYTWDAVMYEVERALRS